MRGAADTYLDAGVEVFGINGAGVRSHRAFVKLHHFTARLLSDRGLHVSRSYDALTSFGPFTYINRTVVGVERSGRIAYYKRGMPPAREILAGFRDPGTESR